MSELFFTHFVNVLSVDNIYYDFRALRKECETETRKPSTNQNTDISALKNGPPDIRKYSRNK